MDRDTVLRNLNWDGTIGLLSSVDDIEEEVIREALACLLRCSQDEVRHRLRVLAHLEV